MKLHEVIHFIIIIITTIGFSLEECNYVPDLEFCAGVLRWDLCLESPPRKLKCTTDSPKSDEDKEKTKPIDEGINATYLNMSNSNLSFIEPGAFYNLSSFKYLDLSGNSITDLPYGVFNNLMNLEEIYLARNKISCLKTTSLIRIDDQSSEPPCAFINCEPLIKLDVSKNQIDNFEFGNCSKLETLDLSRNNIKFLFGEKFKNLTNLKILNLAGNKIGCFKVNPLGVNDNKNSNVSCTTIRCDSLTSLNLSGNKIENLEIVNCTQLVTLKMSGNNIKNYIFNNSPVVTLDISDNKLEYISRENLSNLTTLEILNLAHNRLFGVVDLAPNLFRNNELLRELNLSCTSLNRITVGIFMPLRQLKILDLSWNYLTYIPKMSFIENKQIEKLYLNGNHLTSFKISFSSQNNLLVNLDDNLFECVALAKIQRNYYDKLVTGNAYNITNIFGIKCEDKSQYEIEAVSDSTVLKVEYLSLLVRGQDDMKKEFDKLQNFLNETSFNQKHYSQDNMQAVKNTLFQRDVVLYITFFAGFAIVAIFFLIYYQWSNRNKNVDDLLITFNAST